MSLSAVRTAPPATTAAFTGTLARAFGKEVMLGKRARNSSPMYILYLTSSEVLMLMLSAFTVAPPIMLRLPCRFTASPAVICTYLPFTTFTRPSMLMLPAAFSVVVWPPPCTKELKSPSLASSTSTISVSITALMLPILPFPSTGVAVMLMSPVEFSVAPPVTMLTLPLSTSLSTTPDTAPRLPANLSTTAAAVPFRSAGSTSPVRLISPAFTTTLPDTTLAVPSMFTAFPAVTVKAAPLSAILPPCNRLN